MLGEVCLWVVVLLLRQVKWGVELENVWIGVK